MNKPEDPHADRNGSAYPENFDLLAFEKYKGVYEKSCRDQNAAAAKDVSTGTSSRERQPCSACGGGRSELSSDVLSASQ